METSAVTIRPATAQDATDIAEVHVSSWRNTYRGQVPDEYLAQLSVSDRARGWRENFLQEEQQILLARATDQLVGFVNFGPSRDADASKGVTGEVYAIYLKSEAQGQGLGTRLWEAACRGLVERGFTEASVWVLSTNEPAIAFYTRMGAKFDGGEKSANIGGREVTEKRYRFSLR